MSTAVAEMIPGTIPKVVAGLSEERTALAPLLIDTRTATAGLSPAPCLIRP